jgi:hypothetical protein
MLIELLYAKDISCTILQLVMLTEMCYKYEVNEKYRFCLECLEDEMNKDVKICITLEDHVTVNDIIEDVSYYISKHLLDYLDYKYVHADRLYNMLAKKLSYCDVKHYDIYRIIWKWNKMYMPKKEDLSRLMLLVKLENFTLTELQTIKLLEMYLFPKSAVREMCNLRKIEKLNKN